MNLAFWLLSGSIISIIAARYFSNFVRGGIFGAIALGVLGALQGGFLAIQLLKSSLIHFDVPSLLVAIAGAVGLLLIGKVLSFTVESEVN